jgi:hypothetical protein
VTLPNTNYISPVIVVHPLSFPYIPDAVELLFLLSHPSLLNHPPILAIFLLFFLLFILVDEAITAKLLHYFHLLSFSVVDAVLVLLVLFEVPHLPTTTHTSQRHYTLTTPLSLPSDALAGVVARHYPVVALFKNTRLVLSKLYLNFCLRVLEFEVVECFLVALIVSDPIIP